MDRIYVPFARKKRLFVGKKGDFSKNIFLPPKDTTKDAFSKMGKKKTLTHKQHFFF